MSPIGDSLRNRIRKYPSLLNCCTIDWLTSWPKEALSSISHQFIVNNSICDTQETEDAAVEICEHFHTTAEELAKRYY
jgi:dynein heavy chain